MLTALSELGHTDTITEAIKRFNAFVEDRDTSLLPPDTRKVFLDLYLLLLYSHDEFEPGWISF